ncbi:MAG TPA: hypothetical protein VGH03_10530, partial [Caulobacteraceae bacterium]
MGDVASGNEAQGDAGDQRISSNSFGSTFRSRLKALKVGLARALTPSDTAWSVAAFGLYVVWVLLFLSFIVDRIARFSL